MIPSRLGVVRSVHSSVIVAHRIGFGFSHHAVANFNRLTILSCSWGLVSSGYAWILEDLEQQNSVPC